MRTVIDALTGLQGQDFAASTHLGPTLSDEPPPLNITRFASRIDATSSPVQDATFATAYAAYPKSHIRHALELVPKYDGHNIPVWQFARACKRAKYSIPQIDEALLVRMLKNRLSHHAYLAIEDETHTTVNKFLDSLKKTFGPGRSSNYYRGQLSIAFKKQNEHILDYIGRIKDLRTAIIEGDQANLDRTLTPTEISTIEAYALEAFYEGLPREYRTELRAEGYTDFADACAKTITINKRLEREESRYRNNNRNTRNESAPGGARGPVGNLPRDAPGGLSAAPATTPPTAPDVFDGARKVCTFCKNYGHLVHECRKRQYRMNNPNSVNNFNNNGFRDNNNNNFNNRVNNNNNSNSSPAPQRQGNRLKASASGTARGQGNVRPVLPLECVPEDYTFSAPIPATYPS
ncbi:hypothetical protein ALC62_04619 [Cyphomyrmex costatus]|uniref:CCHC-type domain-containing protein n=1 Tax=Cyphomyrmex costatus TaxID=456900 RepID=A0A151IK16_9HYME|nr:hypothetical protein ALC62_04619 [Cyphomyrmex costatus]